MDGFNSVRLERLAWSPDDKSIIFSGTYGDIENHGLFKLDVLSGKVTYFLDPGIFSSIVVEPDWAP
jgi:Tol biopolymer transport system component